MAVKSHNRPSKDGYGYTHDSYDTGVTSVTGGNVFAEPPRRDTVPSVQRSSSPVRRSSPASAPVRSPVAPVLSSVPSRPAPDRPQAVYYTGYGGNGSDPAQADRGGYVVDPVAYQRWLAEMAAWEAAQQPQVVVQQPVAPGAVAPPRVASSKLRGSTLHIESPEAVQPKASTFVGYDALAGRNLMPEVNCKPRPKDNTPKPGRGGPGGQRKFIPWCD